MTFRFANFAESFLSAGLSIGATLGIIPPADAARMPSLLTASSEVQQFAAVIADGRQDPEVVYVTANAGGVLTLLRGQENTTAKDWQAGANFSHTMTAGAISWLGSGGQTQVLVDLVDRVGAAEASILQFAKVEADNQHAYAEFYTELNAKFEDNAANLTQVMQVYSDREVAYAKLDTTLTAQAAQATATANQSLSVSVGFGQALADYKVSVSSQFGTVNSTVSSNFSTLSQSDLALGKRIDTVTASLGDANAMIRTETQARADQYGSLASQITTTSASFTSQLNSAITQESTARANADGTNATNTTNLTSTVNGVSATANQAFDTGVSLAGYAQSTYSVAIGAGGKFGGFTLRAADGSSSVQTTQFVVDVEQVIFRNPGTNYQPFVFDTAKGTAYLNNVWINAAWIYDATITTAKIGNAQITNAKIGDAQITTAKIGDAQITSAKIQDATIQGADIGYAAIGQANLGSAIIGTAQLQDAIITNAKVAYAAIASANIQSLAVNTFHINNESVTAAIFMSAGAQVSGTGNDVAEFSRTFQYAYDCDIMCIASCQFNDGGGHAASTHSSILRINAGGNVIGEAKVLNNAWANATFNCQGVVHLPAGQSINIAMTCNTQSFDNYTLRSIIYLVRFK